MKKRADTVGNPSGWNIREDRAMSSVCAVAAILPTLISVYLRSAIQTRKSGKADLLARGG